jgi:putative ABC transport system ATP-binding protein
MTMTHNTMKTKDGQENSALIELWGVSKHYQQASEIVKAVDDVSLQVQAGDFVSITGRSGSGKTTLLSLIGGLTAPTSGGVRLFDRTLKDLGDGELSALRAEKIGYVFQFASLIPTLSTLDNVRLPGIFAPQPVDLAYARQLLDWVGLSDKLNNYPAELSGGQQARVSLARALANQPDLLLADEPTGNLDVETEWEILSLLRDLNRDQNITIMLVTHNPELAKYGHRHMIMQGGNLTENYQWLQEQETVHE